MTTPSAILLISRPNSLGNPAADVLARCSGDADRLADMRSSRRRRQFLAGRMLLWRGVEMFYGSQATTWRLEATVERPPRLVDPTGDTLPPMISISHAGEWTACAFAEGVPVGVDCEILRNRDWQGLAEVILHAEEIPILRKQPAGTCDRWCLERWVLKEALLKACGVGLWRVSPASINLSPDLHVIAAPEEIPGRRECWQVDMRWLTEKVCVAVAWLANQGGQSNGIEVWMLNDDDTLSQDRWAKDAQAKCRAHPSPAGDW
jgi:phosphopantetheinyl transferase